MSSNTQNRLATIRKSRGVAAADLARRVGVSRQTIYAIEAGTYVPNTDVALRLAHELEVAVEEIFFLAAEPRADVEPLATRLLSSRTPLKGQPARLCQVGQQWVSIPVSPAPYYLPEADGVISHVRKPGGGSAGVVPFASDEAAHKRLVVAGCDPASSLLAGMVERIAGVEIIPAAASSALALSWLEQRAVHIAGSHLEDPDTGEFNLPHLRREFPHGDFAVINFARWEQGFVTAPGNPKSISRTEHLTARNVRFINREKGSGGRALLDRLLREENTPAAHVSGYGDEAYGHLAAAYRLVSGQADCCIATRSAAQAFGLDFVPLKSERYDLVMWRQTLQLPIVQAFLDVLQRASFRRRLETLAGYDTAQTGSVFV